MIFFIAWNIFCMFCLGFYYGYKCREREEKENENNDKIRAEIKALTSNRGYLSCSVDYIHKEIDAVFDKYKAESEDQDGQTND